MLSSKALGAPGIEWLRVAIARLGARVLLVACAGCTALAAGSDRRDSGVGTVPPAREAASSDAGLTRDSSVAGMSGGPSVVDADGGASPLEDSGAANADAGGTERVPTVQCYAGVAGSDGLDPTFGDGGVALTGVSLRQGGVSLAFQKDGSIVIATGLPSYLLRLTPAGALDSSFGDGGIVSLPYNANSLAVQSDDKLLAVGFESDTGLTPLLVRYNSDGSPDLGFGTAGTVHAAQQALTVLAAADGRVLVGGALSVPTDAGHPLEYATLTRYEADGTLDSTFGDGGSTAVSAGGITAMALLASGSVLALTGSGAAAVVFQFTSSGNAIPPVGGVVVSSVTMNSTSTAAVDSQANSIFIRGHGLVRYMAQGELDPNFASPTLPWTPQALVVGASGKIFAGGVLATEAGGSAFALAAFDANGSVDSTFAHNGTSEVAVSGRDSIFALATQPDCRIVAAGLAGSSDTSSNPQLVLARYVDQ